MAEWRHYAKSWREMESAQPEKRDDMGMIASPSHRPQLMHNLLLVTCEAIAGNRVPKHLHSDISKFPLSAVHDAVASLHRKSG